MYAHFSKYTFAQRVYLVTDAEQLERIVSDIEFSVGGQVVYQIVCGTEHSRHYEFELNDKPNEALRLGVDKNKTIG